MGLQKTNNNLIYLKIHKETGKLHRSNDKEFAEPFDELEGRITGLNFKTETYEGADLEKLQIIVQDEEGNNYALSILLDSSYASTFISFARNADLTKTITIVPVVRKETNKEGKEVTRRSLLMKQGDEWIKSYFNKDNPLPRFEEKVVNKKKIFDKTSFLTKLQEVVEDDLVPQLGTTSTLKKVDDEEDLDNLPF